MVQKLDCLKLINFIENTDYFINKKIAEKKILIAFSGGQDSTCLLIIFYILSKKWGFQLGVVYCNHCWRNSSKTTLAIFNILQKLDLPFYFVEAPLSKPIKPEQKARNWRYSAFDTILKWGDYDFLLTGHTLSDCVETTLFNLCRGSGLKGICSLKESQRFCIPQNDKQFNFKKTSFYLPQSSKIKLFRPFFSKNGFFVQDTNSFFTKKSLSFDAFFKIGSKKFFRTPSIKKIFFKPILKNCPSVRFFRKKFHATKTFNSLDYLPLYNVNIFFKIKQQIEQKRIPSIPPLKSLNPLQNTARVILEPSLLLLKIGGGLNQKHLFHGEFTLFEQYVQKVKNVQETTNQISVITFFNPLFMKKEANEHLFFFNSQIQKLIRKKELESLSGFKHPSFSRQKVKGFDVTFVRKKEVILLRPLIKINRKTLFLFLQKLNFEIFYDTSNKNLNITRNYIRKVILPLLKKINPKVEKNIYKFSRIIDFYYTEIGDLSCPENLFDFFIL